MPLAVGGLFRVFGDNERLVFLVKVFRVTRTVMAIPVRVLFNSFFIGIFTINGIGATIVILQVVGTVLSDSSVIPYWFRVDSSFSF